MNIWTSLLVAIAASLALEGFAARRWCAPSLAPLTLVTRLVLVAVLFAVWLALLGRPLLAGFATLATTSVLTVISMHKRHLVGEPLVFADFGLVRLILRHPDLYYLEALLQPRVLAGGAALVLGLGLWLWFEPPALGILARLALLLSTALLVSAAWFAARSGRLADRLAALAPEPDLEADIEGWGLLATLVLYALRWRAEMSRPVTSPLWRLTRGAGARPDLVVVVQFESFLDPVRAGLSDAPLPGLARARDASVLCGPLGVPAHGAFTMRSEHAVLTGIPGRAGFRGFDPYLSGTGSVPETIATRLAQTGWRTLFIHPFRPDFFNRARLLPRLGFPEALWEDDFRGAERQGPYVSDRAVVHRILAEAAREPDRPALIVAVTMENHGPWSAGRLPGETDPTRQYLHHLRGSDAAISELMDGLSRRPGRALVCLYGDHPPILPGIDRTTPPETDYVVLELGQDAAPPSPRFDRLSIDALGRTLFALAQGRREPV